MTIYITIINAMWLLVLMWAIWANKTNKPNLYKILKDIENGLIGASIAVSLLWISENM